ncbi:MAG: secretin N-terminal domain-containing protein [Pseudomonadota bacterium]
MIRHPLFFRLSVVVAALLLAGCAASMAYRDGKDLVEQGRVTEGLARFEEASRLDPGVAQYRVAVLRTREQYIAAQIERAEALRRQGRLDDAEQVFRLVLGVHGGNDRALAGLRAADQQRRISSWMKDAESAAANKDGDTARTKLKAILLDEPSHEGARALLQKLDDQIARPAPENVLAAAYRKPISIEFKDVPLKVVFEVISRTSGMNFLFDKDVHTDQKTSIFLKNSTIENAVSLTLLTNQLEQRVLDGNTVLVYPNTQAKQKDYQLLTVRSFYLANAEAKTVAATLKALLKTRDVVVDDKLNLLIVRDTPEAIRLAEKLVALHDVPEPEVMLEVEILEVKRTRLLDLGIRWPDQLVLTPLASGAASLTLADLRGLNSASIGAGIGAVGINAKKTDTDANILANPRIRVRNREKAKILIGERVPNITSTSTSTGFVAESINYVDVGLKLDVEPTIYLDGEVAIKVALEVSNIISQVQTKSGSIAYQIGTRTAQTVLRLKDGENQVLAGLINDEDRRSAYKVPGLGEVPVVGRLFGSQSDDASKTEIVLSITPRIVRNVRRPDAALIEFESGTENSFGVRSVAAGAASAAPVNAGPAPATSAPALAPALSPSIAPPPSQPTSGTPTVSATPAAPGALASTVTPAPPGGAILRWQGPAEVKVGDIFAVQLLMQSDQPLMSVPLAVGFDARMLQATSVSEGEFLRQDGAQTSFASRVDPSGQVLVTATRTGDTGATALGVLATINFRATAAVAPEARVQLLTAAPVGVGGRSVAASPAPSHVVRIAN